MMRKTIAGFIFLVVLTLSSFAQRSTLQGLVIDEKTGETIVGAQVVLEGTTTGAMTDFDGNYEIKNITPGTYTLVCKFISYEPGKIENINLVAGNTKVFDFKLGEAMVEVEEVTVTAKVNRQSETMLLLDQKEAEGIKESIGAKQLSNMGVSDAAGATTKISGVTKTEGSGDIFIRGLGDRYLSTTMNHLPIPSDDVSKKNINLNLFATDIISNVAIGKTYDVSTYGDQASGNVDITSKTVGNGISIGLSGGVNSNVIADGRFSDFKAGQNINDIAFGNYKQPYDLKEAVFKQSWNTSSNNFPVNFGLSVLGGKEFEFSNGDKLSLVATAAYSGDSEFRTGTYRKYESNGPIADKNFTDVEEYITEYQTTGLVNLTYDFSKDNSISYKLLYTNKTEDELFEQGRNGEGYFFESFQQQERDLGIFIRDQNIKTTKVLINQLLGKHKINESNTLEWGLAYNVVNADEPNRIRNKVSIQESNVYYATSGGADQRKSSQEILDNDYALFLIDKLNIIDDDNLKLKLNFGTNFRYKTRDFESHYTSVRINDPDDLVGESIGNMDEIFLNPNYQNTTDLKVSSPSSSTYAANLMVLAGFTDISWQLNKFSGNVGIRYENDVLDIDYALSGRGAGVKETPYSNILPALNLKYKLTEKSAIRFASSKTITLPEFKEFAPVRYVSPEGEVFLGDTSVVMSNVYNFDLKWELFPNAGELLSIATFYKVINDPINITLTKGSSQYLIYQNTANQANVYGIELEGKMNLLRAFTQKHKLNLMLNATKMWFKQDILEYYRYNNKDEIGLQGASDFITNVSLSYATVSDNPLTATLTGNYSSDKIFALGGSEDVLERDIIFDNDQFEKGFVTLDFVVTKKISKTLSAKLSAKNLLNPSIERTQMIERSGEEAFKNIVRSYKKGVNINLGLSIRL